MEIPQGTMTYLVDGNGPALVFLHGGLAAARAYIPLLELLGRSFRVIAPTHPGHGDSFALPKGWTFEDFGTAYQDFFAALKLGSIPVVGHSFGGAVGFLLASQGYVSSLVAMDSLGLPIAFSTKNYVETLLREGKTMFEGIKKHQQLTEMFSSTGVLLYSGIKHPENVSWLHAHGPTLDLRDRLIAVPCHVDLLWGEDDAIVPVSVGHDMHNMLRDSTLTVFPHKGHTYAVTDPEFTYQKILSCCHISP